MLGFARGARPVGRAARAARVGRAQDGSPARAVPLARRRDRALRGRAAAGRRTSGSSEDSRQGGRARLPITRSRDRRWNSSGQPTCVSPGPAARRRIAPAPAVARLARRQRDRRARPRPALAHGARRAGQARARPRPDGRGRLGHRRARRGGRGAGGRDRAHARGAASPSGRRPRRRPASPSTRRSSSRSRRSSARSPFRTRSRTTSSRSRSRIPGTCTRSTSCGSRRGTRSSSRSRRATTSSSSSSASCARRRRSGQHGLVDEEQEAADADDLDADDGDLGRPARPAREHAHLPGRRGGRLGRPLRAAGGLARRPLPDRRRPPRGAADPEAHVRRGHDPPEGAREDRHRGAAQAAGRPHHALHLRGRAHAGHPSRDAADGRGREGRHAPARQVEEGADAARARALRGDARRSSARSSRMPTGALLVTGPTGSGKSTTLYACLAQINRPEINIITVEDPVEYRLAGVNQVQINVRAGLTFASSLRSILRSDPDVVMVGRDPRRRDGEDLDRGRADGALRALDAAHERRALDDHAPRRDGRGAVPHGRRGLGGAGAAARAEALHALLRGVHAERGGAARVARLARGRAGVGRGGLLSQEGLPALQPHRLPRARSASTSSCACPRTSPRSPSATRRATRSRAPRWRTACGRCGTTASRRSPAASPRSRSSPASCLSVGARHASPYVRSRRRHVAAEGDQRLDRVRDEAGRLDRAAEGVRPRATGSEPTPPVGHTSASTTQLSPRSIARRTAIERPSIRACRTYSSRPCARPARIRRARSPARLRDGLRDRLRVGDAEPRGDDAGPP